MSEVYEGVVFNATGPVGATTLRAVGSPLHLRLVQLDQATAAIYRVAARRDALAWDEMTRLGAAVSRAAGRALAVGYDNQVGLRVAALFESGSVLREFDEADELWVPLDEEGAPMREATPVHSDAFDADEEYDCLHSAIDLGLAALGTSASSGQLKQACCYDEPMWSAECLP